MKTPKFGTKNVLFGYFWARILKKLLSYLILAPSNLPNCKILEKTKTPKFGTKNSALSTLFLGWNLKILLSYLESESSNLSYCKVWCKNKNP